MTATQQQLPVSQTAQEAQQLIDQQRSKKALKLLKRSLRQPPASPAETSRLRMLAGIANFRLGDFAAAQRQFQLAGVLDPHDCYASYYQGLCEERQGNTAEALLAYRLAMAQAPGFPEARFKADALSKKLLEEAPASHLKPRRSPGYWLRIIMKGILFIFLLGLFATVGVTFLRIFVTQF